MNPFEENRKERMAWWHEAKFGMFVHWGLYSEYGRGEQVLARDLMPLEEYEAYADQFQPDADWAERIAEQAVASGAKYVVLTTRHHDGYCLWDTNTHDFSAPKTGPGRDLVREFVETMRKHGLKVGLYFSVVNWRWKGYWDPKGNPEDLPLIVEELHTQLTELMSGYGKIDILWYDVPAVPGKRSPGAFGYENTPVSDSAADFYRSEEINAKVRELQPHILINNRSGTPEDFSTPEQKINPAEDGKAWEACMTLNYAPNWGNVYQSIADKTPGQVLHSLMDAVRLGGNFLFNVGPDGKGNLCKRDSEALRTIGAWLERNGEAVYGTQPGKIYEDASQGACSQYGMFTQKGKTAYLTLFYYPKDFVIISKIAPGIRSAEILGTGQPLEVTPMNNARWKLSGLPREMPDDLAAVIKIEFEDEPYLVHYRDASWLEGTFKP